MTIALFKCLMVYRGRTPSLTKLNKRGCQTINIQQTWPEIRPIAGFSWQNALTLRPIGPSNYDEMRFS